MQKAWKVLKVIIFIVGLLSIFLLLSALFVAFVLPLFEGREQADTDVPAESEVYVKEQNGYRLVVKRKGADHDIYLLSLSRDGREVTKNYRLPTQKYQEEHLEIYDASFMALPRGAEGVLLFTGYAEECSSDSRVWIIRTARETSVLDVLDLTDVHRAADRGLRIFGTKRFSLPYQDGFRSEPYVVPVIVRIGDPLTISPLLTGEGADALRAAVRQEVQARRDKLPEGDEGTKLEETYRNADLALNELLAERMIPLAP